MTGVVIGGAGVALGLSSDIVVNGVVYRGSTLNWQNGVVLGPGTLTPVLNLSGTSIASTAATGTLIGNFSVTNGTGVYTFTLTSNPGNLFQVSGTALSNAVQGLSVGIDPITAKGDNGSGSVATAVFNITVTGAAPQLNFSIGTTDSQMLIVV